MNTFEFKGSNVDAAIKAGLTEMGKTIEEVDVEIINKGGFLKKAAVRLTVKEAELKSDKSDTLIEVTASKVEEEKIDINDGIVKTKSENVVKIHENDVQVVDFLKSLLNNMGLDCSINIKSNRDLLTIVIGGPDTNFAIGYRGETLDSLQYLCLLVANKNTRFKKKLIIDAEGYRELRAETLTNLSKKLAIKVSKSGRAVELEPMNPYERRIIHTALQNDKYVITSSEGVEPNRFVVISPKPKEDLMYDQESRQNFKKTGIKTRSFGQKQRRF